jgi:hypothetical protein
MESEDGVDVAQLLLALLNEFGSRASTARHLLAGGLGPLVLLAQRKSDSVCVWAIKLVAKVCVVFVFVLCFVFFEVFCLKRYCRLRGKTRSALRSLTMWKLICCCSNRWLCRED